MAEPIPPTRWTDADRTEMFSVIGRYLIIFQTVESKLDQILLLGWGHENWDKSQRKLAEMTNEKKIDAVQKLVLQSPDFARVHKRPEWCQRFEWTIQRLHDERRKRNALVHSQYLFDFMEIGYPPLRSLRKKGNASPRFDEGYLSKAELEGLLHSLTQLAVTIDFIYVQLVSDYRGPTKI